ncbi:methionyl-tRNA synthetase [Aciduliprofundum sp. MAR08-339]|uniref:methionine--tRNA ligase n=1 Tax=Aciduliprofundum sp. (strain MAR08-339) TaxID=673860 RepID=UPI0002A488B5|nr:methionyl-tRNA synthetase [Aciduliprofundum sp. MAR08-339]
MRIFIGVAWPYANGPVHLGHIVGAYLPADIFARYQRMQGNEVLMVSGSDQHGTPITLTAEKEGVSPQEVADRYHKINSEVMERMGISFDLFFRTSDPAHRDVVKRFFLRLYENGYLYRGKMLLPYCPSCHRFLPDRYVVGTCPYCGYENARGDQCDNCGRTLDPKDLINPRCAICGTTPEFRETEHVFFSLSKLEKRLLGWLADKTYWRSNVLNFTRNFIKGGLKDRAITRDIEWGVEVPLKGFENKRIYVWFDAVIGYLSASVEWAKRTGKSWRAFWMDRDVRHYYFLGKDNIPFHTIIWPAMLMAHGELNLPYNVVANEYLRFSGEKFSKSRGIGVWMPELLDAFHPDIIRFYGIINMPENRDSDFTWDDFVQKVNEELIDKFANFVHRALIFAYRNFGEVPPRGEVDEVDREAIKTIMQTLKNMQKYLENVELKKAFKEWMNLARFGNVYFDRKAPWALCKENKERCATAINISLQIVQALAILGAPFLPFTAEKIWHYLGNEDSIFEHKYVEAIKNMQEGRKLNKPEVLFEKIKRDEERYEKWEQIDLRVALVESVEDHPNADKLYVLRIDLGDEKRTLIAGLKRFYKKEELLGKKLIVVCNLEPANFRGVRSEGMLLAGEDDNTVGFLTPLGDVEPGARVQANGVHSNPKGILKFKKFQKMKMEVADIIKRDGKVVAVGKGEYPIDYRPAESWAGKQGVVFHDKKPLILHVGDVPIGPVRYVKPGGKIR